MLLLLIAILSVVGLAAGLPGHSVSAQPSAPQTSQPRPASAAEIAAYELQLAQYHAAHDPFEKTASEYWNTIAGKRKIRSEKRSKKEPATIADYVLAQPPVYSGPPQPIPPPRVKPKEVVPPPKYVPVIADFLKNAEAEFQFKPERPASELKFKRAYAKAAAAAGLTKDQIVRIYAFETGGNSGYDLQAGFERKIPSAHAVSTALGYNQLLHVNTVEILADKGDQLVSALQKKARKLRGARRLLLFKKIAILRTMIAFTRSVPDDWPAHVRIANTPKGLGIHALNLDIDVGPLLQVENLATSVAFARRMGIDRPLTAAELEMMNLAGDGNGFDIVVMPESLRTQVPTANFFERDGYEANPVIIRNNTVAKLLSATNSEMDEDSKQPGAKALAAAY